MPCPGTSLRHLTAASVLLMTVVTASTPAQEVLRGEFRAEPGWDYHLAEPVEGDGVPPSGTLTREREEEAVRAMLEEARWTFGGIIYGFDFLYEPADPDRGNPELFILEPRHALPTGDPSLTVAETLWVDKTLYVQIDYHMSPVQALRRDGWRSAALSVAGGTDVSDMPGPGGRASARENALRRAVRDHLRARIYRPPRRIEGRLALAEPCRMAIAGGGWRASARIYLDIRDITDWPTP